MPLSHEKVTMNGQIQRISCVPGIERQQWISAVKMRSGLKQATWLTVQCTIKKKYVEGEEKG